MPVMDGLSAARQIRLFERESKISREVIVALTGAASESDRQEAFSAGIDRFLIKPVPMKALKLVLEECAKTGLKVKRQEPRKKTYSAVDVAQG